MTESPEYSAETTNPIVATAERPAEPLLVEQKPNRLYQVAAWVAIVAGTLFIVALIFFSGFVLGRHSGGDGHLGGGRHHGPSAMWERGGPPMMHPGPGMFGPGPGNFGPGGPGGPSGPGVQGGPVQPTPPTR